MQAEERIKKLQELMAENGVDLAAIGPTSNMRYLLQGQTVLFHITAATTANCKKYRHYGPQLS